MDSSTRPERWGGVFHDGEEEDDEGAEDFIQDWHSLVLLLAFTYFSKAKAKLVVDQCLSGKTTKRDHEWMVYAAASLPSCPRPIVDFLCSCFLEQTCKTDAQGYTPLIIAAQRQGMIVSEPADWNEDWALQQQQDEEGTNKKQSLCTDCAISSTSIVDVLLEWSPNSFQITDAVGQTVLHHAAACRHNSSCVVESLLNCNPISVAQTSPAGKKRSIPYISDNHQRNDKKQRCWYWFLCLSWGGIRWSFVQTLQNEIV